MNATDFRIGFLVLGDVRQPRRTVDAAAALTGYAGCDPRCQLDRESFLSAYQFDCNFGNYLVATGSTAGYRGPTWAPWLWLDIDAEGNLPAALDSARRLAVLFADVLNVGDDDALFFFSGSKGFHAGLPTSLWAPAPGPTFHLIARRFAVRLAELAGVTIDAGVYDRVRCFRAPNSTHPRTGLHKRRLTVDELMHLSADRVLQLAAAPSIFELPAPTYRSESAAELWAAAAEAVQLEAQARAERLARGDVPMKLNRRTLDYIKSGADNGDRHRLTYSAAANLAELGAPLPLCFALLEDAALDTGLTPGDVRRAIENGWASLQPGVRDVVAAVQGEVVAVNHAGPEGGAP